MIARVSVLVVLLVWASTALAHKPSDSYLALDLRSADARGHWDIALRDLDRVMTLDQNGDGALTWGELHPREHELEQLAFASLRVSCSGAEAIIKSSAALGLVEHSDGRYVRLPFVVRCREPGASALTLHYQFFFALDPQHRCVVRVTTGSEEQTFVLSASRRELALDRSATTDSHGAVALIGEGIRHILSGLDHVLFLLALLLPSVLRRDAQVQTTGTQIRSVLRDVVKVVTAFTVAHSLTLGLAALGVVSMSARVIEPAIAASVAVAALDNLWPVFGEDRWSIAFALGLLHGFGFSSALADLGLHGAALLRALFAFNLGVELGQLALVGLFVPLAFALRTRWVYRFALVRGGSLAIVGLSIFWFVDRVRGDDLHEARSLVWHGCALTGSGRVPRRTDRTGRAAVCAAGAGTDRAPGPRSKARARAAG